MLPPLNQHNLIYTENECMDFTSTQDLSHFLTIEGKKLKKERNMKVPLILDHNINMIQKKKCNN